MLTEAMEQKLTEAFGDQAFLQKITPAIDSNDIPEVRKELKEKGIEMSEGEVKELLETLQQPRELSDEDLEEATGGLRQYVDPVESTRNQMSHYIDVTSKTDVRRMSFVELWKLKS